MSVGLGRDSYYVEDWDALDHYPLPDERKKPLSWSAGLSFVIAGCLTGLLTAVAIFVFQNDIVGSLLSRQANLRQSYEDQILTLRGHVDQLAARQLLDQAAFDSRIDTLLIQQKRLVSENTLINLIIDKSDLMDAAKLDPEKLEAFRSKADASSRLTMKALEIARREPNEVINRVNVQLEALSQNRLAALSSIETQIDKSMSRYSSVLQGIGVKSDKIISQASVSGIGGPFVPVTDALNPDSVQNKFGELSGKLSATAALENTLRSLPIQAPIAGGAKITSTYGNRRDPFRGGRAFHGGIDFKSKKGTQVLASGGGKVIRAGRAGGYGLLVEIQHKEGYISRYAHLSKILVKKGDSVAAQDVLGKVGSTGRSTGPHLHFEVRKNSRPVDPMPFVKAGKKVAHLLLPN